jgi:hypothetical protein
VRSAKPSQLEMDLADALAEQLEAVAVEVEHQRSKPGRQIPNPNISLDQIMRIGVTLTSAP